MTKEHIMWRKLGFLRFLHWYTAADRAEKNLPSLVMKPGLLRTFSSGNWSPAPSLLHFLTSNKAELL